MYMYYELIDLHNDTWMNVFKVDHTSISILNPYDNVGYNDKRSFIELFYLNIDDISTDSLKAQLRGKSVIEAAQIIDNCLSAEKRKENVKPNILFEHILEQGNVAPKDELDKIDVMEALK